MTQFIEFSNRTANQQANNAHNFKSVQSWRSTAPAVKSEAQNFESTLSKEIDEPRTVGSAVQSKNNTDGFQFDDILDTVNPLHHLPVIGMIYRGITGDTIKPASQIIGGSLFGGPVGALTGTINAVAQIQTGKDVTDNVLAMAGISSGTPTTQKNIDIDDPESRLNAVAVAMNFEQGLSLNDLPKTAISFASLPETGRGYTKTNIAEGRTAGNIIVRNQVAAYQKASFEQSQPAPVIDPINLERDMPQLRDVITQLSLSPMPERRHL